MTSLRSWALCETRPSLSTVVVRLCNYSDVLIVSRVKHVVMRMARLQRQRLKQLRARISYSQSRPTTRHNHCSMFTTSPPLLRAIIIAMTNSRPAQRRRVLPCIGGSRSPDSDGSDGRERDRAWLSRAAARGLDVSGIISHMSRHKDRAFHRWCLQIL